MGVGVGMGVGAGAGVGVARCRGYVSIFGVGEGSKHRRKLHPESRLQSESFRGAKSAQLPGNRASTVCQLMSWALAEAAFAGHGQELVRVAYVYTY